MKMKKLFNRYFWKYGQKFYEHFSWITVELARSYKARTVMIAQAIAVHDKINFKSAWMLIYRWLSDPNFQIDDGLRRYHSNMIFYCHVGEKWPSKWG
jgi:hypothetical protein